ncbi:lipid asymmetry maintenance protein MlaB [Dechloromonas sp. HYN0024]|uniref:STAS domain-containing protein n=1 Tax=Dechloromonas sp. HYN0024 TaxID=2231055 RepID=UPI000E452085|nr:STAS domain-containing protein [Dechloromonas sp. HYN0024]AXS80751.1 anti-sigma factor antagonist [Dechloromonas sp. HYN0024]
MIELQTGHLVVKVPMVIANARGLLEAGRSALQAGEQIFDFSQVSEADSSALAVMLGWLRAAGLARSTVRFAHTPAGVLALAELYGITDLLPLV